MAQFLLLFGSGMGQEALEGRAWGCYLPLLYTEGNQGPGRAGDLTPVILVAQQRHEWESRFQSQCPFCKAVDCIRTWIQVEMDSGLVQPLLGWVPSCSS